MNKYFQEVLTYRALSFKLTGHLTGGLLDSLIDDNPDLKAQFKNTCVPIPLSLSQDLEEVLSLLRLSKREFLTMAIRSAIDDAKKIMDEVDIFEYVDELAARDAARENMEVVRDAMEAGQ